MDQDGLEILNEFRAAGVPAISLLMDVTSYQKSALGGATGTPAGCRWLYTRHDRCHT